MSRTAIAEILRSLPVCPPAPPTPPERKDPERLAYTMRETAELLGVSYITVHRLWIVAHALNLAVAIPTNVVLVERWSFA